MSALQQEEKKIKQTNKQTNKKQKQKAANFTFGQVLENDENFLLKILES